MARKEENITSAPSIDSISPRARKKQLPLFAEHGPSSFPHALIPDQGKPSKSEKLAALLEGDLNFHGENGNYASHHLHAFAARFPPQLPRAFIRGLSVPGDIVLDPMMGSGTTVVEALLEGRRGVGLDIDPLALRLCQAKTKPVQLGDLQKIIQRVVSQASLLAKEKR